MNLHGLVRGAITRVNPDIKATLRRSVGSVTKPDGSREPQFKDVTALIQVQALSGPALQYVNNLQVQGVFRAVYLYGKWSGLIRADQTGGDVLQFPQTPSASPQSWRIITVLETWPDWSKVIVWLQ